MEKRPAVRRYAAEGVVIVVGVLIALAADALWDYRADRADEQAALLQLDAEFADNAVQLDSVRAGHMKGIEAAEVLLGVVRGSTTVGEDSIRDLVRSVDLGWTFNPKSAALESIIQSGRLGLILDDSLRIALVGWPGIVEDLTEDERLAADFAFSVQFEALSGVLNWGDLYGPEPERTRPIRLAGNESLEGVLAYRYSWYEWVLDELDRVDAALVRVRRLLERNLRGPG